MEGLDTANTEVSRFTRICLLWMSSFIGLYREHYEDAIVDLGSKIGDTVHKLEENTLLTQSTIRNAAESAETKASITLDEVSKTAAKASFMLDLVGAGVITFAAGYTFSRLYSLGSQVKEDSKSKEAANAGVTVALITVAGVSTAV